MRGGVSVTARTSAPARAAASRCAARSSSRRSPSPLNRESVPSASRPRVVESADVGGPAEQKLVGRWTPHQRAAAFQDARDVLVERRRRARAPCSAPRHPSASSVRSRARASASTPSAACMIHGHSRRRAGDTTSATRVAVDLQRVAEAEARGRRARETAASARWSGL